MDFNVLRMKPNGDYYRMDTVEILPFKSIVWEESYNDIGKLQAVFPRSLERARNIQLGDWGYISGANTPMYIHSIKETDTELWVYGYEAKAVLQKEAMRPYATVMYPMQYISQAIEYAWYYHVSGAYKIPSWMEDQAPSAVIPALPAQNLAALEYWSVYDCIRQCCALVGAGYRLKFLPDLGLCQLYVWQGADVSDKVRFARELGNVSGLTWSTDNQSYVSQVTAIGLDGETEVEQTYGTYGGPLDPTEAYLDLRLEFPKPDGMTRANYEAALLTRAQMSWVSRSVKNKLDVKNVDTSRFGTAFILGDIVGVTLPEHGLAAKARVKTLRRTIEGNRDKLTLDLSTSL